MQHILNRNYDKQKLICRIACKFTQITNNNNLGTEKKINAGKGNRMIIVPAKNADEIPTDPCGICVVLAADHTASTDADKL